MNALIGKTLAGRYRVDAFLGKGGMAEVYKVWDSRRAAFLAMKLLREDLAEDKVFLRRFRREAHTLEQLQHPYIVRYYGLEQDDDLAFMLMDFVDGTTLRKVIFRAKQPFLPQQVLDLMRPVCSAVHYAHQMGMIHCDLKPGNIMIHNNGTVLVADFGISRMTESATTTLVGAGTPAYMAPEQVRGETPLPQSDIYSLGVVLFEMLTGGERPFTGEKSPPTGNTNERVRWEQQYLNPPSPRQYNPSLPIEIEAVVLKCLEKDPGKRYQSALDLLNDLAKAIHNKANAVDIESQATAPQRRVRENKIAIAQTPSDDKYKQRTAQLIGAIIIMAGLLFGVGAVLVLLVKPGGSHPNRKVTNTSPTASLQAQSKRLPDTPAGKAIRTPEIITDTIFITPTVTSTSSEYISPTVTPTLTPTIFIATLTPEPTPILGMICVVKIKTGIVTGIITYLSLFPKGFDYYYTHKDADYFNCRLQQSDERYFYCEEFVKLERDVNNVPMIPGSGYILIPDELVNNKNICIDNGGMWVIKSKPNPN